DRVDQDLRRAQSAGSERIAICRERLLGAIGPFADEAHDGLAVVLEMRDEHVRNVAKRGMALQVAQRARRSVERRPRASPKTAAETVASGAVAPRARHHRDPRPAQIEAEPTVQGLATSGILL